MTAFAVKVGCIRKTTTVPRTKPMIVARMMVSLRCAITSNRLQQVKLDPSLGRGLAMAGCILGWSALWP